LAAGQGNPVVHGPRAVCVASESGVVDRPPRAGEDICLSWMHTQPLQAAVVAGLGLVRILRVQVRWVG